MYLVCSSPYTRAIAFWPGSRSCQYGEPLKVRISSLRLSVAYNVSGLNLSVKVTVIVSSVKVVLKPNRPILPTRLLDHSSQGLKFGSDDLASVKSFHIFLSLSLCLEVCQESSL